MSVEIQSRVEQLLGSRIVSARHCPRGYTAAGRWLLSLADTRSVFAKFGTTAHTAEALRLEAGVYAELQAPFMPKLIGWEDHTEKPLLILENLESALWPPPWDRRLIDEVHATLEMLHRSHANLKPIGELDATFGSDWASVAENPEPFLGLRIASKVWLQFALPVLLEYSSKTTADGEEVLHLDVRSDNLCRTTRGIVLVDWNYACLGNGALDLGFWLPSLKAESGVKPEELLPSRPDVASIVSGFFAARAGLPPVPDAPQVRAVQLQQLKPALSWVARELDLPEPDLYS